MKIAVVTDSSSAMKTEDYDFPNLFVLPMPITLNGNGHFEDITITQPEFYETLKEKDTLVSTSQPSIFAVEELWDEILTNYDAIIHIPLSSGLSKTLEAASTLALKDKFKDKVFVCDNKRVSITLKESVLDALEMINDGYSPKEIQDFVVNTGLDSSIYIMVPTLKYLKRGGRVTAAGAALGTLLNIKPVLQIQGGKLDAFKKVASIKKAKEVMVKAIYEDVMNRFKDFYLNGELTLNIAHTQNVEDALEFKEMLLEKLSDIKFNFIDPLSLVISCHIGPGSLACAVTRKYIKK